MHSPNVIKEKEHIWKKYVSGLEMKLEKNKCFEGTSFISKGAQTRGEAVQRVHSEWL